MASRKKYQYLRQDRKHGGKASLSLRGKIDLSKSPFWSALIDGELPIKLPIFVILSIASSVLVYFLYMTTTKSSIVSIGGGLMAITLPYLVLKTPIMMTYAVNKALSYKEFINTLQSSLRATNSTHEALQMVSKEKGLTKEMTDLMQQVVSDLTLGDSIEQTLERAIEKTEDVYLKMALSIVKINHNVGSSKTILSLNNIQTSQDMVIENVELLKDKINSIVLEKTLFLAAIIACPVLHNTMLSIVIGDFYSQFIWQWVAVFILLFAYAGQFVMDYFANKAMKEL